MVGTIALGDSGYSLDPADFANLNEGRTKTKPRLAAP